jgi:asparagine synthase (glutamine-hydrolysing)
MCGIVGIYSVNNNVDPKVVKRMAYVLRHRGPDDEGFVAIDTLAEKCYPLVGSESRVEGQRIESFGQPVNLIFGHRRLSILDLSFSGHQTMTNRDSTLWVVYNGEIYNYIELREELKGLGHHFKTNTDTEVLLYSYEQWGQECLARFNGMWSFVIYDTRRNILFASRDRFGKKPFYYYYNERNFVFASEIKALLSCPFIKREPNDKIVYDYLVLGCSDHTEETFFKDIKQLEPGYALVLSNDNLKITRYYQLSFNPQIDYFKESECDKFARQFLLLLEDAVRLRLRSDVPVGTCLSGGLDSSTIVFLINALLRKEGVSKEAIPGKQKTFSSCFENLRFDERKYISKVTENTYVEPHNVFPSGDKLWEELEDLVWHQEEPFGSTSVYAQWNVMRLAKENGVKVILDGQGADELLAGYWRYIIFYLRQLFFAGRLREVFSEILLAKGKRLYLFKTIISYLFRMSALRYLKESRSPFFGVTEKSILGIMDPMFFAKYYQRRKEKKSNFSSKPNFQEELWKSEVEVGLKILLRYEDKNSMAFSIEARCPFVDYRLVEFIFSLTGCYKIHHGWTKYLLRQAGKDFLPKEIRWRRDKMAFPTPERIWLISNRKKIIDILEAKDFKAGKYIDPRKVLIKLDSFLSITNLGFPYLWRFINLELWMKYMHL